MPSQTRIFHWLLPVITLTCYFTATYAHEKSHSLDNSIEAFYLPENHPLHKTLPHLFRLPIMFRSPKILMSQGFDVKVSHRRLMIAGHPDIPHYLIKKFVDRIPQSTQLGNFLKRIRGANALRHHIKKLKLKHIVVPKKWLYQLSKNFPPFSYVLVVEKMDIYDDWDNPDGKARKLYYNMDKDILTELCILLHTVGGCDSIPRNQPFTQSGQIAFIDTEHYGQNKGHFYKHILPALNPELQAYATALWEKLQDEENERKRN